MNISIALLIFTKRVRKFIDVEKHEEGWALDVHPSCSLFIIFRRKDSAISCTPKRKPYEKASRSVILCISFIQCSNFSSISFCFSVSVPSKSSRFRATSFKSSFSRLSPRVHYSKGDHSSLIISIMFVPPVSTQRYHRRGRKSRPFSKIKILFSSDFIFDFCEAIIEP